MSRMKQVMRLHMYLNKFYDEKKILDINIRDNFFQILGKRGHFTAQF